MNENLPVVTLFMLSSIDGKISTGSLYTDDFDKDLIEIDGVKEGLYQYYDIEKETDTWTAISGKTMHKVIQQNNNSIKMPAGQNYVIYDTTNLTPADLLAMLKNDANIYIMTRLKNHPAYSLIDRYPNLNVMCHDSKNPTASLTWLKENCGCQAITLQGGGALNASFLMHDLVDKVKIVVAPILIGGDHTPGLISSRYTDGMSIIQPFKLSHVRMLKESYIELNYERR